MSERYSPPEPEDTFTALMKGFELSDEARQDIAAMNDFEISTAVDTSGEPAFPFESKVQFVPITVPRRPRFARYIVPQTEGEDE